MSKRKKSLSRYIILSFFCWAFFLSPSSFLWMAESYCFHLQFLGCFWGMEGNGPDITCLKLPHHHHRHQEDQGRQANIMRPPSKMRHKRNVWKKTDGGKRSRKQCKKTACVNGRKAVINLSALYLFFPRISCDLWLLFLPPGASFFCLHLSWRKLDLKNFPFSFYHKEKESHEWKKTFQICSPWWLWLCDSFSGREREGAKYARL